MIATSPAHAIELLDNAFNRGDLETILRYYEEDAIVIAEPGKEARGKQQLRSLYERAIGPGNSVRQISTKVIEAGGVALFISRYALTANGAPPEIFVATTVFRQQSDGGWKALIDNARGPAILEEH